MEGQLPLLPAWHQAESVIIEFEGRKFGWVERNRFPHQAEHEPSPGPMVTCLVDHFDMEDRELAAESLQRLLSALAFHYNTRIESRNVYTGSGTNDLLHPYGAIEPSDTFASQCVSAPARVHVSGDARLRVALALYREALSAASPFYRLLAFWNVLDAVFKGDEAVRDDFLRQRATGVNSVPNASGDVAKYLRDDSRNAIAHVVRRDGAQTSIDADQPADRERLSQDAYSVQRLSRIAILEHWADAVGVESSDGLIRQTF